MVMHQSCHSMPWCNTTQSHSGHLFGCVLTWSTSDDDTPSHSALPQQGTISTRCSTQQPQQPCHSHHTWGCCPLVSSSCVSAELNCNVVSMWCAPFTLTEMLGDVNHWLMDNCGVISDTPHGAHLMFVICESHSLHHSTLCVLTLSKLTCGPFLSFLIILCVCLRGDNGKCKLWNTFSVVPF